VRHRLVLHRAARQGRRGARASQSVRVATAYRLAAHAVHRAAERVRRPLPPRLQWYWRADFVNEISDAAIDVHLKYGEQLPTGHSTMHMYPIDGAASRVPGDATAFAYRDGGWAGIIAGVDPDPANVGLISQWAKDYWQELHPTTAGGAYVNFLMVEGQDRVKAAYRGNYDLLTQVKDRYDPENIFHINQNILPASASNAQAGKNVA
jgi:FAD/FMN-containing dehydrogenase